MTRVVHSSVSVGVLSLCIVFQCLIIVTSGAAATRHIPAPTGNTASILSEVLDDLDLRSDNRVRPGYGGAPVQIRAFAFIRDVVDIDEDKSTMTVNLLLMQMWTDPRLSFESERGDDGSSGGVEPNNINEILIDNPEYMSRLWNPDTFIMNEVATSTRWYSEKRMANQILKIARNGEVLKTIRITVVVSCPMRFENYPVQSFECDIDFESFGHKADGIMYSWRNESKSADLSRIDKTALAGKSGYSLESVQTYSRMSYVDTGGSYSRLVIRFQFKKLWLRHALTYFLPTTVLTACALLSLWAVGREHAAQGVIANFLVAGGILLLVGLEYSTSPVLCRVPFFTPVDFQLGICASAVFSCVAYHGVNLCCSNSGCYGEKRDKQSTRTKNSDSEASTPKRSRAPKKPDEDEVTYYESYNLSCDEDDDSDSDDVFSNDDPFQSNTDHPPEQDGTNPNNNDSPHHGGMTVDAAALLESRRRQVSTNGKKSSSATRRSSRSCIRCIVRTFLCLSKWLSLVSFVLGEALLWYTFTIGGGRGAVGR